MPGPALALKLGGPLNWPMEMLSEPRDLRICETAAAIFDNAGRRLSVEALAGRNGASTASRAKAAARRSERERTRNMATTPGARRMKRDFNFSNLHYASGSRQRKQVPLRPRHTDVRRPVVDEPLGLLHRRNERLPALPQGPSHGTIEAQRRQTQAAQVGNVVDLVLEVVGALQAQL